VPHYPNRELVSNPRRIERQAAADRFNSEVIRKRLEYWTFILEQKFSKREPRRS